MPCLSAKGVMRQERNRIEAVVALTFFMLAMLVVGLLYAHGADRCRDYIIDVRSAHTYYFGSNYPYWYGVGQLRQESNCRPDITAFDGGQGISQMMPATERDIEKALGELDMYNPEHAIRAQAWYMARLDRQNPDGRLFINYMFYNSGPGTIKKEAARAGVWNYEAMRAVCKRKILTLKSGKFLDLCNVGYDYPKRIYKYGQPYRISYDRRAYW